MKKYAGTIYVRPSWKSLAPAIIDRLLSGKDKDKFWADNVTQLATIADDYIRLVENGIITQKDTNINLSKIKINA